jgi:hypothetical protein
VALPNRLAHQLSLRRAGLCAFGHSVKAAKVGAKQIRRWTRALKVATIFGALGSNNVAIRLATLAISALRTFNATLANGVVLRATIRPIGRRVVGLACFAGIQVLTLYGNRSTGERAFG